MRSSCRLPSLDDPRINPLLEQRQRHRPGAKRNIVEGAQIELVFERFARTRAKIDDLLHNDIIRGGLTREDVIALALPLIVILARLPVGVDIGDPLLAAPLVRIEIATAEVRGRGCSDGWYSGGDF